MSELENDALHDEGLRHAVRQMPEPPCAPPAIAGRVEGRVRRAKVVRSTAAIASVLALAVLTGVSWRAWQDGAQVAVAPPREQQQEQKDAAPQPAARQSPELGLAVRALAAGPPVARLDVLDQQQAAVWQSLEEWTKEL